MVKEEEMGLVKLTCSLQIDVFKEGVDDKVPNEGIT